METKNNGGTFRSKISLSDAQEHVAREKAGLPRVRTLTLQGETEKDSLAEIKAIFGE